MAYPFQSRRHRTRHKRNAYGEPISRKQSLAYIVVRYDEDDPNRIPVRKAFDRKADALAFAKKEHKRTGHEVELFDPNKYEVLWHGSRKQNPRRRKGWTEVARGEFVQTRARRGNPELPKKGEYYKHKKWIHPGSDLSAGERFRQVVKITRVSGGSIYYRPVYVHGDRETLGSPLVISVSKVWDFLDETSRGADPDVLRGKNPRDRNSITGKKLIAQWRDSGREGGYGYIHGDSVPELLKKIKARLEDDPNSVRDFTISRVGGKDIGVGDTDDREGTITWNNWNARAPKVIKFKSRGRWGVFPWSETYHDVKPIKVFDTYQKADKWLHEYEGDLRLSGVPRKVNGRAKGVGIVATRKALRQLRKANPVDVEPNPDRISSKRWYEMGYVSGEQDRRAGDVGIPTDPDIKSGERFEFIWSRALNNQESRPSEYSKMRQDFLRGYYDAYIGRSRTPTRRRGTRRVNPNGDHQDADRLYEQFHGRPSTKTTQVETRLRSRDRLSELGDLVELRVVTPTGKKATLVQDSTGLWHTTRERRPVYPAANRNTPMLSSSPDKRQLYIEGGVQAVDLDALGLDGDWRRDSMLLGVLTYVTYRTEKGFDEFQLTDYYHKLGEETGDEPVLVYDSINELLSVAGGLYEVTPDGIVN